MLGSRRSGSCLASTSHKTQTHHILRIDDHYCPWIGTVVAKNNTLYFSIFVACLTLKLTLDTAVLSYAINQQEKEDEAAAAKCLLFLPLIGLFILLVGMAFRVARGAKTKARFHRPQGGDGGAAP